MALGFVTSARRGQHYDLAKLAVRKMKSADLAIKERKENVFEKMIVTHLRTASKLKKNLITQVATDEVDKITQTKLFGFSHRPDISIGNDGTAIEVKLVTTGPSIRDLLGQALVYRMHYRFVILILIDKTTDSRVVNLCQDKKSQEHSLLAGLADKMNIFSIVCPAKHSENQVVFVKK